MKKFDNSAFSLLEILMAAIIFILTVAGVFATMSYVRQPVAKREGALLAAQYGKRVFEALRSQVSMAASANYYGTACNLPLTTDGSCPDFTLSIGQHEVTGSLPLDLAWPLKWPSLLTICNPNGVVYTVSCSDKTTNCNPAVCVGAECDIARQVKLTINWPDPTTDACT